MKKLSSYMPHRFSGRWFKFVLAAGAWMILAAPPRLYGQPSPEETPRPLREDIRVEFFMETAPGGVRIRQDPVSGDLFYNTLNGDIYHILPEGGEELLFTSDDHGVTIMQGMAFHERDLIVVGNIQVNEGRGMVGKVMRGRLQQNGERIWSTIAESAEYGSMMSAFGHAFNAVAIDPTGEYIYVNSGSRTDHGEVQDNRGAYPGHRERAITSVIFRLPINGEDIFLADDEEQLKRQGLIFADGVRNVFSIAFSPDGQLFGVDNAGDYHHPEGMYWLREGHHYGFPWVIGGYMNPQQFPDFKADPATDPGLERFAHAVNLGLFHTDPDFPPMPEDLVVTPAVQNIGPDANWFMDLETGRVLKADQAGRTIGTFTPHRSPLGLFFDSDSLLTEEFRGDAFVLSYTAHNTALTRPFYGDKPEMSEDLMHLKLFYSEALDNYVVRTTRIVDNFSGPTDAVMVGNEVYVINNRGGRPGQIWKIILPAELQ